LPARKLLQNQSLRPATSCNIHISGNHRHPLSRRRLGLNKNLSGLVFDSKAIPVAGLNGSSASVRRKKLVSR
jgi:hypothetical protein